jgi:hypothetical protein
MTSSDRVSIFDASTDTWIAGPTLPQALFVSDAVEALELP